MTAEAGGTTSGILRRVGMLGASQAMVLALNFATWVHLARSLTPDRFGVLSFGTALLAYFLLVVILGFEAIGMREVARAPGRVAALAGNILGMRLVLLVIAGAAYAASVMALPQPPLNDAVLLVLGINLLVRATQLNWAFVGLGEVGAPAARDVGAALMTAAAAVALVDGPDDLLVAAAVTVIPPLLCNALLAGEFVRRHGSAMPRFDRRQWPLLLAPALPLAASAFLSEVYYSLDKVMLEFLRTTAEVGLYGAAYKLLTLALAPAFVLYQAYFPSLSSAYGDAAAMRRTADGFARVLVALGLPMIAAGPFLATDALVFVFGAEYAPAGPALALLLVNAGIVYVAMSFGNPLMAWNLQRPYMGAIAWGAGANVALNIALIPRFGLTGAAVATAASEIVVLVALVRIYLQAIDFDLGGYYVRVTLAAVVGAGVPAFVAQQAQVHVVLSLVAVVGAYGVAAWALGVFRQIREHPWATAVEHAGVDYAPSTAPASAPLPPA